MADKTKIEWTDATWNPITGCTRVSPGCDHCYMFRDWDRLRAMGNKGYQHDVTVPTFHLDRLGQPLRWKKSRRVFVCSMSDLFHPAIPWDQVCQVFDVMADTPRHTFQVLTKRPGRMMHFANYVWPYWRIFGMDVVPPPSRDRVKNPYWPPNVWAGTTVESAKYLPRLEVLAQVPAKVRFASCEPLLDKLGDLSPWLLGGDERTGSADDGGILHWVIAGGESGRYARPMRPDDCRDIRDQCQAAGVPFFFKQWGEWLPEDHCTPTQWGTPRGRYGLVDEADPERLQRWANLTTKAAGAVLDGREWREFPA